jgi:hypothetical protein
MKLSAFSRQRSAQALIPLLSKEESLQGYVVTAPSPLLSIVREPARAGWSRPHLKADC